MGGVSDEDGRATQDNSDNFGVVVGWTSDDLDTKIMLKIQSVRSAQSSADQDVQSFHYFLTKNQAAVLGNYLVQVSGLLPPQRHRRTWLHRIFGG